MEAAERTTFGLENRRKLPKSSIMAFSYRLIGYLIYN
jgi:hypothetical protein